MSALHYWSIEQLSEAIRTGEISPVEVVRTMLDRIEVHDGRLHSYITVMREQALARARIAEDELSRGLWRGALHGVPLAVKDLFATRDAVTTAGMSIYKDHVPQYDATVVKRLYAAGAILLGKLTLTEGAYTNNHPIFPVPLNPWNEDYWAGTSSNGSGVATAAGLTYGALSTDTGGSIRFPSACNNVTGIKPTWGGSAATAVLRSRIRSTMSARSPAAPRMQPSSCRRSLVRTIAIRQRFAPTCPTIARPRNGA